MVYCSSSLGEVSEWFKEPVLKTGDSERGRGFESHLLRFAILENCIRKKIYIICFGEVPKRLKGLPWKGSRSLIAARGFKSLLLRSQSVIGNTLQKFGKYRELVLSFLYKGRDEIGRKLCGIYY